MKNIHLVEGKYGHGAIPLNFVSRKLRRLTLGSAPYTAFDWVKGYDADPFNKITIKDQGISYSCGGQAGAYFLEIQNLAQGYEQISAKSVYAPIAYKGGGTTITSIETQIGAHGANLETEVPSGTTEPFMEDLSWQTSELTRTGLRRAGYTPLRVPIDIEAMASYMRDYGAIIWEIRGQNNFSWADPYPKIPSDKNKPIWTHYMCSKGARLVNGVKTLDFYQSWGPNVGDKGVQHFTEDYINSGFVLDCFTFAKDAQFSPTKETSPLWIAVWEWFMANIFTPINS